MSDPPDLQQILNTHLADYCQHHPLDAKRARICRHIQQCHTEAMGGMQMQCDRCGHEQLSYYGCRDRHCPQCQYRASRQWAQQQQQTLLPVTYYHLIFTLPHDLNPWAQLHPEVIYRLLFQAVWSTLRAFALNPKRLGGQLGVTAVLHTWGQNLSQHIHLHCLIPGGVLTPDGAWKPARSTYLFPVKALSRHFRGALVSQLRHACQAGELPRVTDKAEPRRTLDRVMSKAWVVYSKPCINHSRDVVAYLARYSHRTAISNHRILAMEDNRIRFRYKDPRDHRHKEMELEADEFIRRYLLHLLPKGLQRFRHYGFLANSCRATKLPQLWEAIGEHQAQSPESGEERTSASGKVVYHCPQCRQGRLLMVVELSPKRLDGG